MILVLHNITDQAYLHIDRKSYKQTDRSLCRYVRLSHLLLKQDDSLNSRDYNSSITVIFGFCLGPWFDDIRNESYPLFFLAAASVIIIIYV